jgi:hypothetical protein
MAPDVAQSAPLRLARDLGAPEVLTAEADSFDRAARCLRHMGVPGGDLAVPLHCREVAAEGYMLAVRRLEEQARARRELLQAAHARTWEANPSPLADAPPEAA